MSFEYVSRFEYEYDRIRSSKYSNIAFVSVLLSLVGGAVHTIGEVGNYSPTTMFYWGMVMLVSGVSIVLIVAPVVFGIRYVTYDVAGTFVGIGIYVAILYVLISGNLGILVDVPSQFWGFPASIAVVILMGGSE